MGFLLFCILVAAYFEADRIFTADILKQHSKVSSAMQTFDKSKVFDLKAVAGCKQDVSKVSSQKLSELVNGHAKPLVLHHPPHGPPPKRKKDSGFSLFGFLRGLLFRQAAHCSTRTAHCMEQHAPHDNKDGSKPPTPPTNPVNGSTNNHKQPSKSSEHTSSESWSFLNKLPFLRPSKKSSKAAKRQQVDLISNDLSNSNDVDVEQRKQDSREATPQLPNNNSKHKATDTDKASSDRNTKRKERNHMALTENQETTPFINIVDEDADDDNISVKKESRRKQQRKSKVDLSNKRIKEFKVVENEKDETSSNTTESSSLDTDDKVTMVTVYLPLYFIRPSFDKYIEMQIKFGLLHVI